MDIRAGRLLTLMLLVAAVLAAASALPVPRHALAAPAGLAEFEGSGQDGTRVEVVVNAGATAASTVLSFTNVTPGCPVEARFPDIPLTASGNELRVQSAPVNNAAGAAIGTQSVVGFFETLRYASATGAYEFVPATGIACPARQVAWRAGSSTESIGAIKIGGGYSAAAGSAYPVAGTTAVGVVSLRAHESGGGLASFSITYRQGACSFTGELAGARFYDAGPSLEYRDGRWAFTIASHASSASGGIVIAAEGSCPGVALYYTAVAGANVPPLPTPSPTPSGGGGTAGATINGSIPRSGGFGLVVFSGGTIEQLVAATGCPASSMAVWATLNGVFVGYIPGTPIAAPNAAFIAAFPGRVIPPATALVGKCA